MEDARGAPTPVSHRLTGNEGEHLAMEHLRKMGFEIIETNYRHGHGEIDIIARDGQVLVFCEVKARRNDAYGAPEYALTPRKQQQIRKIARAYLYEHEITNQECRFDVVAIRMKGRESDVNYIGNAF
jgi:putative endonuclease